MGQRGLSPMPKPRMFASICCKSFWKNNFQMFIDQLKWKFSSFQYSTTPIIVTSCTYLFIYLFNFKCCKVSNKQCFHISLLKALKAVSSVTYDWMVDIKMNISDLQTENHAEWSMVFRGAFRNQPNI